MDEGQKLDWIHLPKESQETSIWTCLHDGELVSCISDLLERFVIPEFRVRHLTEDKENPISFLLKLEEVTSVRAIGHFRWIGKFEMPENVSHDEARQLVQDYWSKWREESLSWSEFEAALATDPLQISDASYVNNKNQTTLRLGGFLDGEKFDDIYFDIFLRGKRLFAFRTDGQDFTLERFIELGMKYWDSFGK